MKKLILLMLTIFLQLNCNAQDYSLDLSGTIFRCKNADGTYSHLIFKDDYYGARCMIYKTLGNEKDRNFTNYTTDISRKEKSFNLKNAECGVYSIIGETKARIKIRGVRYIATLNCKDWTLQFRNKTWYMMYSGRLFDEFWTNKGYEAYPLKYVINTYDFLYELNRQNQQRR
nr:MAG TPA: hypothetical protein [Caudoviricetes sp.]